LNLFEDLRNKIGRGVAETSQASIRMIKMGKINFKLKEKKREADEIAVKIGWVTYNQWEKDHSPNFTKELIPVLEQLGHLQSEIKLLEVELENVKNDQMNLSENSFPIASPSTKPASLVIYLCPYCAHQVDEHDRRCANCNKQYY
jgi:hypothetical protein